MAANPAELLALDCCLPSYTEKQLLAMTVQLLASMAADPTALLALNCCLASGYTEKQLLAMIVQLLDSGGGGTGTGDVQVYSGAAPPAAPDNPLYQRFTTQPEAGFYNNGLALPGFNTMRKLLFLFLLLPIVARAANPSFNDFSTNQFSGQGNKIFLRVGALITNANLLGTTTAEVLTIGSTNIISELAGKATLAPSLLLTETNLGTIANGGTATLTTNTFIYYAAFAGETATIALPTLAANGKSYWARVFGTNTTESRQVITVPALIRDELSPRYPVTTITNNGLSAWRLGFESVAGVWRNVDASGDALSFSVEPTGFDADALLWRSNIVASGSSVNLTTLTAASAFVTAAKSNAYWTKLTIVCPVAGDDLLASRHYLKYYTNTVVKAVQNGAAMTYAETGALGVCSGTGHRVTGIPGLLPLRLGVL